jgi:SAM-dependent methyltransferase
MTTQTRIACGPGPLFPALLRCLACGGELSWAPHKAECGRCGRRISIVGNFIPDFLGGAGLASAEAVLTCADETIDRIRKQLPEPSDLVAGIATSLISAGEMGADELRSLFGSAGPELRYHVWEHRHQVENEDFVKFLEETKVGGQSRVLDVGCGAGQSLRLLNASRYRPSVRIGVDNALAPLALGDRLARLEQQEVCFVRATGRALPFPDGFFSHIISRGALNYMHQRGAIEEMIRVLEPGGFLFLRIERFWHDLNKVRIAISWRDRVCRLRDLGLGISHAVSGLQAVPFTRLGGGRAFVSVRRLKRMLRPARCKILRTEDSSNCPTFLGRKTQTSILAQRT